jgi:hypothetical protein
VSPALDPGGKQRGQGICANTRSYAGKTFVCPLAPFLQLLVGESAPELDNINKTPALQWGPVATTRNSSPRMPPMQSSL